KQPTDETIECQRPKPIVLATGEMKYPYDLTPFIVEIQLLKIGNIIICVVPAEFTTMNGGSTIYGPNNLNAYLQLYTDLSVALADNFIVPIGPTTPDFTDRALNFIPPVIVDIPPLFKSFEITDDVEAGTYHIFYQGYHKLLSSKIIPESGFTSNFTVS
ncbi:Neutral/alkaline non-lysosomal ceramidase-domain-containing protein, partial [Glomus cerebriforme]